LRKQTETKVRLEACRFKMGFTSFDPAA
jgi:hypothetical protein